MALTLTATQVLFLGVAKKNQKLHLDGVTNE
jgi:hypothetical protein